VTAAFAVELLLELRAGPLVVAACEVDQAAQPVQRDCAELRPRELGGQTGRQLALGFVERLAGNVDGGREPVRQREFPAGAPACDVRRAGGLLPH
jgi:hypothetical protein